MKLASTTRFVGLWHPRRTALQSPQRPRNLECLKDKACSLRSNIDQFALHSWGQSGRTRCGLNSSTSAHRPVPIPVPSQSRARGPAPGEMIALRGRLARCRCRGWTKAAPSASTCSSNHGKNHHRQSAACSCSIRA
jgi:hypothetical protein